MGADKPPASGPAILQIARNSLGPVLFFGALAAFFELGHILNQPLILPAALLLAAAIGILRYSPRWLRRFWAGRRERARRLANYPLLVEEVRVLKERVNALELGITRSYHAGLREARDQIAGRILGIQVKEMPTIMSVSLVDGRLQLTCRREGVEEVPINARFSVVVSGSNQPLGALAITGLADAGQTLTAEPVEETDAAFWQHLKERANHDHSAPNGIKIDPYLVPDLPPLPPEPPGPAEGDNQPQLGGQA